MADSNILPHAVFATLAWLCVRVFPSSKWFSKQGDKVSESSSSSNISLDIPLNTALHCWLSNTNSDPIINDVDTNESSTGLTGVDSSSTGIHRYLQTVHHGSGNLDVELKVQIFLDLRDTVTQDEQLFIRNMREDGFEDEIQSLPGSGSVFGTTVRVQEGLFPQLTRLLSRASRLEETSTLQVGSWGIFYSAGEQLRLLKFDHRHGIPKIHQVSQIATRTLSIQGQHLEGADITALANSRTVPITVFWPKDDERAQESEELVATLPENGLDIPDTLIIQAVKTLSLDEESLLVRSQIVSLQLEQPIRIALRGLLDVMPLRSGWLVVLLVLLHWNFSNLLVNILLNAPAVWMVTWFFVQLLPEDTIMSIRIYCTKVWEDGGSPGTPEVHTKDAVALLDFQRSALEGNSQDETDFRQEGNSKDETDVKQEGNSEDEINVKPQEAVHGDTNRSPPGMSSPASSQGDNDAASQVPLHIESPKTDNIPSAAEWYSSQLSWNKDSAGDATNDTHNVSAALSQRSDSDKRSSASNSSRSAIPTEEVTVLVDRVEINQYYQSPPQIEDASASPERDFGSIDTPTDVSWSNGSPQILLGELNSGAETVSDEHNTFPSIDEDDLIKFFPEKCKLGRAHTRQTFPPVGMEAASTTSSPSRFSMRSLLSRLKVSQPRTGSPGSSKGAVQTMSSVVISHRPDSASHTVVAAFDATKKLTFEAVDWGLLQMDLWPGDTLVVLGVITKIRSPLGIEVLADLNGFSGLNPRVLQHEIAQRLMDYQKKLLARRLYCQKKGLNMEVRITAGHPLRNVIAKEVVELNATWVIMDNRLAGPARFCLQKCSCGVVLMNKKTNVGQFLRMAQQPSLTDPFYGGKYVRRQYTTAPIRFEDYDFEHPEGSPCASSVVSSVSAAPGREFNEITTAN